MFMRNRDLINAWYTRMWNTWNKNVIAEICTEAITFRGSLGEIMHGHREIAAYMDRVRAAFPDFTNTVELIISEHDHAFARLTYTGTHQGPVLGFQPTNRRIGYAGAAVFTFRADKIADVWVLGDLYGLVYQLRAAPEPPELEPRP
jgi:predicted ester cyclase